MQIPSATLRCLLTLGLFPLAMAIAAEPVRTIILVRHAERAGGTAPDVGISDAGQCRAKVLATMLGESGIKAIYASEVKRTQQTAEPLAAKLHVQPEVVPAKELDALIAKLRQSPAGETRLVVGHSNTVPMIVEQLGGGKVAPIADTEFDRMFIVTLIGQQEAKVLALRYPGCAQ